MNKFLLIIGGVLILFLANSCNALKTNKSYQIDKKQNIKDFLLNGYVISDKIYGDLNNDGLKDCIIITKATDKSKIVKVKNKGKLDRNRRGILILLNINGNYELAEANYNCFASENEDGGNYFAPILNVEIKNDDLYIQYNHGRYGYWEYIFRFQNSNFVLIGFNQYDTSGPVVNSQINVNYLTKTKIEKRNVNVKAQESGDEVFNVSENKIELDDLVKLSEIKYFDMNDISED